MADAKVKLAVAHARIAELEAAGALATLAAPEQVASDAVERRARQRLTAPEPHARPTQPASPELPAPVAPTLPLTLTEMDPLHRLEVVLAGGDASGTWFHHVKGQQLEVRPTPGRGRGLYTTAAIPPFTTVCIYGGRLVHPRSLEDRRYAVALHNRDDVVVDGSDVRNDALSLTHAGAIANASRAPNCTLHHAYPSEWRGLVRQVVPPVPTLRTGSRGVEAGAELVWNYVVNMQRHQRGNEDADEGDGKGKRPETLLERMQDANNWQRRTIGGLRDPHAPELVLFCGELWLRVGPSRVCGGRGVFAERKFAADELILVYDGEACAATRGRSSQHVARLRGGYVDGEASVGGMLNTSRTPNAELRASGGVYARCGIVRGEEVCIPYGVAFHAAHM